MKRIPFLAIVLLAFAFPAHAQDAMKKDAAVKPADPELKVVLDSWNEIGRKLTAMAEDFPEDKYDFKPTPAQRSFAEQLLHAAGSCYYFTNPVMGQKPPGGRSEARPIQVQGRHRCVRQEILRRWRSRHPVERRKRHDDGGCSISLSRNRAFST